MSLKHIQNKIRSVKKTHKVTKAMEAVSAVKMRKSQERALAGRPYAHYALSVLKRVSGSMTGARHPLMQKRRVMRLCIVLVTSDKGLTGSLNSAVIREAYAIMKKRGIAKENVSFVCVGKKGLDHFSKRGFFIEHTVFLREENIHTEELSALARRLTGFFLSETYDECVVLYTRFLSTMVQEVAAHTILPLSFNMLERIVKDIVPVRGRYAEQSENEIAEETRVAEYLFEPSPERVLDMIVPFLVAVALYHTITESVASEHSARMVAMKNASSKAEEVSEDLTLVFNRVRQAAITREVSELVGGIEAMR